MAKRNLLAPLCVRPYCVRMNIFMLGAMVQYRMYKIFPKMVCIAISAGCENYEICKNEKKMN